MKKLRYIFMMLLAVTIVSCEDDDITQLNDSVYAPATNIQGFGTSLAISKDKKAETIKVS
nr:hypothetical protein [Sunxiuqinia sp.]